MRVLFYFGSVLGWVFLIYFCWNQSIPWWFKKGVAETVKTIPEITKTIPREDWAKPKEETKVDNKKPSESTKTEDKKDTSKKLFSGEFNLGGLRSRYNLDVPQNDKSEQVGKQDMGGK
jgi:hypothetical protein